MGLFSVSGFGEILLFIIGGALFVLISLFVSRLVRPSRPNPEKLSTYESGEETVSSAWSQFNIRFYIVALTFILFETEVVFLFPWATVFAREDLLDQTQGQWGWFALWEAVIFIVILGIGLAYVWYNGYLDWVKPRPQPTAFKSPVPREYYEAINRKYAGSGKSNTERTES